VLFKTSITFNISNMASATNLLITGAARGIGKGLVEHYLLQPNYNVIAAVRNLDHPSADALKSLPKHEKSTLIVVKIDSLEVDDPDKAVEELSSKHSVTSLDIVIANAGISEALPQVHEVQLKDLYRHFDINVAGVILLFKAVRPLLLKTEKPKFITISSTAGSIGAMQDVPFPNAVYGSSKATLNYLTRKIHFENSTITAVPLSPGYAFAILRPLLANLC
jgi:norsolorinic acid ketoreductase